MWLREWYNEEGDESSCLFAADIQAVCTLHGEQVSIRGQTHFSVKNFDVKFSIGGAKVFLGDLFNGDRELGKYGR